MAHYTPIHFYLTFNPHLNDYNDPGYTQAHEFYEYIIDQIKNTQKKYAYWGKMIAKNRVSKMDIGPLAEVIKHNQNHNHATHLYLTDYNELWVGKIESVHRTIKDKKTLSFYDGKNVELWFKISDFALLEFQGDATAKKLSELYIDNQYMDIQIDELSPFTTGIRFPAFVQDLCEENFFNGFENDEYLALKPNPAINDFSTANVVKNITSLAIPHKIFDKIPRGAKLEIERAEMDMLERSNHKLTNIAFSYIKSLEIVLNDLVIHHLKRSGHGESFYVDASKMPPKLSLEMHPGYISLENFQKNFSIGQILYFIDKCQASNNFSFKKVFGEKKNFINYVSNEFSQILNEYKIIQIRGVLAHGDSQKIENNDALTIRNLILGVADTGLINALYLKFYGQDFAPISSIKSQLPAQKTKAKLKLVA
ncbi:MAG: hypothetical protein H6622_16475 [Halobacteriovoraceae bacterium]|nr:hypothetical protein [Halobacteriovoraceae bacterium]